jgi:hypothetical protein
VEKFQSLGKSSSKAEQKRINGGYALPANVREQMIGNFTPGPVGRRRRGVFQIVHSMLTML